MNEQLGAERPGGAQAEAGLGSGSGDPLMAALLWLCRHHGVDRTAVSLLNGQVIRGQLMPTQAVRMLKDAGFNATLIQRPPGKILSMLLPAVLLLRNGDACVVTRRVAPLSGQGCATYDVVMPGTGEEAVCQASEEELLAEYAGYALIATPNAAARQRMSKASRESRTHWLWGTLRRYVPYYRASMLAAFLSNVLMMMTGLFTGAVYDKVIPHKAMVTLWSLGAGALIAIAFDMVAKQLRAYLIELAGRKADVSLGNQVFRQALSIRLEHRPDSSGAFAHRVAQIEVVREFLTSATVAAVTDLPFVALYVFMCWAVAGPLVVVLLVAIPSILGLTWLIQSMLRKLMRANMSQHADLHGVLIEAVEGLEDLRAAGAHGHFLSRYEECNAAAAGTSMQARTAASWSNNFALVSQQLVTIAMLVWGVHLIHDGQLTGGALIAAVMFATRAIAPLSTVVGLAARYQGAKAALIALDELMATPVEREPGKRTLSRPKLQGQLALHDVRFAYPQREQEHAPLVLKGVNLMIKPGERVAVLGKIGSGKSTILRLLGGLYQPGEGFVEVDGVDLRQVDLADFRSQVGFVSQEPKLFQGTLRDNVLLGRPHADPNHFIEVAGLTGLDRMAAAHPMGYDLPVGQAGSLLSGGQRQLVALARCLVIQPKVLLLDEPTSSMDAQAETSFIQHLKTAVGNRTLVVITHRPALLEVVDRIVVMEAGRIIADGPKADVLAALAGQKPPARPGIRVVEPAVQAREAEPASMAVAS